MCDAVELALALGFAVAAAADHRAHAAIVVHRDDRCLAHAARLPIAREDRFDRRFACALRLNIERGLHDEIVVRLADHLVEQGIDPIAEVTEVARRAGAADVQVFAQSRLAFRVADEALGHHFVEHDFGALARAGFLLRRVEPRGRFDEAGEQRRLQQRELARGPVEITFAGGFDAPRAGAEIDAGEIEREQLILGEAALKPDSERDFLEFAAERAAVVEE